MEFYQGLFIGLVFAGSMAATFFYGDQLVAKIKAKAKAKEVEKWNK